MIKSFDVIVIGAGTGLDIVSEAAEKGMKVALIEKGPMGGTCLNRGCIPSKILLHYADVAETISNANEFYMKLGKPKIDFKKIVETTSNFVDKDANEIELGIRENKNITLYKTLGKFVGKKIIKVKNEEISADKIFIVAGTRPSIPQIKGIENIKYLTSDEALRLKKQPKDITFIGGGYIACELAHFYGSLGSKVKIIQRNKFLVPDEDLEIAKKFTEIFSKKYNVYLEQQTLEVLNKGKKIVLKIQKKDGKGPVKKIETECLVVATGRVPNTDILEVDKCCIKTNNGFIVVNEYLETNVDGVWALGDIIGKYMFKHSANFEAGYLINNVFNNLRVKVDYWAMPHAVFSSPQLAGVGYPEDQLKENNIAYFVGKYDYINTGMGVALKDKNGFVKILVGKDKKILGCHIIGSDASILIHEVIVAMKSGNGDIHNITNAVHVHPALSEVVQRAAFSIQ